MQNLEVMESLVRTNIDSTSSSQEDEKENVEGRKKKLTKKVGSSASSNSDNEISSEMKTSDDDDDDRPSTKLRHTRHPKLKADLKGRFNEFRLKMQTKRDKKILESRPLTERNKVHTQTLTTETF